MKIRLEEGQRLLWKPISKRQVELLRSTEDEVFFGGAKGGAKSEAVLMKPLKQVHLERFKALILRQTFPEVQELIDRSHRYYTDMAERPVWNGSLKRWTFPNPNTTFGTGGGIIQFGHCKTKEEVKLYHGGEWAQINYDEVADVKDEAVWIELIAENRCPNPLVRRQMIGTGNPGKPGHPWCKRRFIDRCGKQGQTIYRYDLKLPNGDVVQRTRRFIPSRVTDNPIYANDPVYMAALMSLPEVLRRQLLFGDWDAGFGLALEELDEMVHIIPSFKVPASWTQFGALDWGYQHPWVFGHYASDEDGRLYKLNTIRGRWMSDRLIAERINDKVPVQELSYIVAGHDCWAEVKARSDDITPSTAERFQAAGIILSHANISRAPGLRNFREQVAWKGIDSGGTDGEPNFFWMDTPTNRKAFEACASMVVDPDDAEDALGVDANPMTGEGGDDDYDETRYALASRPRRAQPTWQEGDVRAFSKAVLEYEMELGRRHRSRVTVRRRGAYVSLDGY
ncbi:MAG: hypothetical protein OEO20_11495 [Gemmatimonadota bacterium]|nr:hypothetical protein [Gemmatimonadota bacterium]MDH3366529.1 hypothetical protein [Gemmatimonadota bacterium]MDH3478918.1 hypothetical protein [Gemmatimonadota bacterium]MDH3571151.1 hypothetical protein [Gemmatimonadota bacterium]